MKFILGKKVGMSRLFRDQKVIPVSLILAGPCFITQIKTRTKDGYNAVQIGFAKPKRLTKAQREHLKRLPQLKYLREFRVEKPEQFSRGQKIDLSIFKEGDRVEVTGISKGKGFAGVVKRWGFKGAPKTHGTKHALREPGAIGMGFPEHTIKGMRMAGRMGMAKITVKNLKVLSINKEKNLMAVSGPVPGSPGTLISIKSK